MDIRKQIIILVYLGTSMCPGCCTKKRTDHTEVQNLPISEAMPKNVEKGKVDTLYSYESQQIDIKQKVSLNVKNEKY